MKRLKYGIGLVLVTIIAVGLYVLNSVLIIGTGYSAKYLCSQVFIADRDPGIVFEKDVVPTHVLFNLVGNEVDHEKRMVTSKALGFMSKAVAVYRKGCGCTLAVDSTREELLLQARGMALPSKGVIDDMWPSGERVDFNVTPPEVDLEKLEKVIDEAFKEPGPGTERNTQAIVIVYKGRIVAEKYEKQFSSTTPMLGWSMSKSVTNALVGILVKKGKLAINERAPVDAWTDRADPRHQITLDQLLRMSSGLEFEEIYGPYTDATEMLYNTKSMARFAASKPLRNKPGSEWYYSSGTTNIIARIIYDQVGGTLASLNDFVRKGLFDRIGMHSAIIEPDASGSFVGSSYMYATARDWARFGLLIINDGVWDGERILPEGWIEYSLKPTPLAPKGEYGAHFWLNAGNSDNPDNRLFRSLPTDLAYMGGFNFQIVAIIPSRGVVIVRLGVTHDNSWSHEFFIRNVLECIKE